MDRLDELRRLLKQRGVKAQIEKEKRLSARNLGNIQRGGIPNAATLTTLASFFGLPETYFLGVDAEAKEAGGVVRIVPVQLEFKQEDDFTENEIAVMVDMTKQFFHTQKQIIKDLRKKMNKRS